MHFDPDKAKELFKLPENMVPMAVLDLGDPAEGAMPNERHNQRLSIKNMLLD